MIRAAIICSLLLVGCGHRDDNRIRADNLHQLADRIAIEEAAQREYGR